MIDIISNNLTHKPKTNFINGMMMSFSNQRIKRTHVQIYIRKLFGVNEQFIVVGPSYKQRLSTRIGVYAIGISRKRIRLNFNNHFAAQHFPIYPLLYIDRKSTRLNSSHLGISYAV